MSSGHDRASRGGKSLRGWHRWGGLLLLGGCSGGVAHPSYVPQPQSSLIEVTAPPPPGRVEVVPNRPKPDAVWVDGEWAWRRRRWAWSAGKWVVPAPGTALSLWVFVRGADGRFWYAPGTWRDAKGNAITPPSPLLAAQVDSAVVVNASGLAENTGATLKPQEASPTEPRRSAPAAVTGEATSPASTVVPPRLGTNPPPPGGPDERAPSGAAPVLSGSAPIPPDVPRQAPAAAPP